MTKPTYIVRGYDPQLDDSLIYSSWTRQIRRILPANRWPDDMFRRHRLVIGELLRICPVRVACHPDKQFVIYSYACAGLSPAGDQVIHMVYTRKDWRRRGFASELLKEMLPQFRKTTTYYTQNTRCAHNHLERPWQLVYHPYLTTELV